MKMMTWNMILDIMIRILMIGVCIDYIKNRFNKLTRTRKIVTAPIYLFFAIWAVCHLIVDAIEIIK